LVTSLDSKSPLVYCPPFFQKEIMHEWPCRIVEGIESGHGPPKINISLLNRCICISMNMFVYMSKASNTLEHAL